MSIIIGIDPGLDGGLAAITPEGLQVAVMPCYDLPGSNRKDIDEGQVVRWLTTYAVHGANVFIEKVHAMPKQGVRSMFTFGSGWGLIRGICAGLQLPYELVTPQSWQRVMLQGQSVGSEYLVASRLWPTIDWRATERCRTPHSGMVDAALIAECGRRRLGHF